MQFFAVHYDAVSSFVGATVTLAFTVYYFVFYLAVRHDRLNLRLSVFMTTLFIYLFGYSMYSSGSEPGYVLFWTRICYAGGAAIVYTSHTLVMHIIDRRNSVLDWIYRIIPVILIASVFWPWEGLFTAELNPVKNHASVIKGPAFPYYLTVLYIMGGVMLARFIVVISRDENRRRSIMPLAFGLAFWFLEAIFDGVFAAILSLTSVKLSLGPIIMTFSLAVYSAKMAEKQRLEIARMQERNEEIYRNLIYDRLSGLFTREYFIRSLDQRMAHLSRQPATDVILFIDIDRFKTVNDELGHHAGDRLIQWAGKVLKARSRKSDVCARYGGDEFLVLFQDCAVDKAEAIAGSIMADFAEGLPEILGAWHGMPDISMSIGILASAHWSGDPEVNIKRADRAMYKSKAGGRNRISVYIPGMDSDGS